MNDRLAVDLVVWVDVRGTAAEPVVSYVLETSSGERGAAKAVPPGSDGLPAVPRRIAEDVLSSLKLRAAGAPWPAWPMPAAPAYDAYVRALGRAHTTAKTEAERVALFEKVPAAIETYPPAVTELGGAYLDLAGRVERDRAVLRPLGRDSSARGAARHPLSARAPETGLVLCQAWTFRGVAQAAAGRVWSRTRTFRETTISLATSCATPDSWTRPWTVTGARRNWIGSLENLVATQDQITKSLIYLGRYREALASHERMESFLARLGRTPDEKEWFYRGVIHLYAGDRDRALEAFQRGAQRWTQRACGPPLAVRMRVLLVAIAMRWRRCWTHSSSTWWWTASGTTGSSTLLPSWGSPSVRYIISRRRSAVASSMRHTSPVIR